MKIYLSGHIMFIHFPMHFVPSRFRRIIFPLLVPALFAVSFFAGQTAAHFLRRPSEHTVSAPVIACGSLPPAFDSGSIPVSADGNWGLGFPSPGQTPIGNASADALKTFDAFYVGDTSKPVIYLTFDAGYENGNVVKILDTLKEKNVRGAFFILGNLVTSSTELVKRMGDEGHLVCNHTYRHRDMSKFTDKAEFAAELASLEEAYRKATGRELSKYYRPPEGRFSERNLEFAADLGYSTIFWSFAYADWDNNKQPAEDYAMQKIMSNVHNGAVILLHPTSSTNAAILARVIDTLRGEGYRFGTLDELCGAGGGELVE